MNQFLESLKNTLKSIWDHYKALIVLVTGAILALGYHKIMIDLLVNSANKTFGNATKKSDESKAKEDQLNDESKQLQQHAETLAEVEKKEVITPDWDQK